MRRTWIVEVDGRSHTVELDHGWISGRRRISVDGEKVESTARFVHLVWDTGSRHHFGVAGRPAQLRIDWRAPRYTLAVGGRTIEPQRRPFVRPGRMMLAAVCLGVAGISVGLLPAAAGFRAGELAMVGFAALVIAAGLITAVSLLRVSPLGSSARCSSPPPSSSLEPSS